MKKVFVYLCASILMMCLLLTGCAKTDSSTTDNPTTDSSTTAATAPVEQEGEKTTLRVAWWGSQIRHDQTIEVINQYMKNNPDVKIDYEFNGFSGYWDKIATQAAASNLPDVWQNSVNYVLSYVEKDQLLDLTPYTKDGTIDVSDWSDSSLACGTVDDKIYALSMGMTAHGIVYNPALFAQAGVAEPSMDWTWEDYMDSASKIKEATGIYGDSDFAGGNIEGFEYFLHQNGQSLFNETMDGLGYTDDGLFEAYNQMALDMAAAGSLMPVDQSIETSESIETTGIVTEKAAMLGACNSNQLVAITSASGKDMNIVSLPNKKDQVQKGNWVSPSMYLTASAKNANAQESAKLINYMLNSEEANNIFMGERGVPGSSKMRDQIMPLLDVNGQKVITYVDEIMKIAPEYNVLRPAVISELTDLYIRLEQEILFKAITPKQAAQNFRKEATQMLSK